MRKSLCRQSPRGQGLDLGNQRSSSFVALVRLCTFTGAAEAKSSIPLPVSRILRAVSITRDTVESAIKAQASCPPSRGRAATPRSASSSAAAARAASSGSSRAAQSVSTGRNLRAQLMDELGVSESAQRQLFNELRETKAVAVVKARSARTLAQLHAHDFVCALLEGGHSRPANSTLRAWIKRLGYETSKRSQNCMYNNAHERADVVRERKRWLDRRKALAEDSYTGRPAHRGKRVLLIDAGRPDADGLDLLRDYVCGRHSQSDRVAMVTADSGQATYRVCVVAMKIPNGDLGLPVVFELHEWRLSVVRTPVSAANTCHGRFTREIHPPQHVLPCY